MKKILSLLTVLLLLSIVPTAAFADDGDIDLSVPEYFNAFYWGNDYAYSIVNDGDWYYITEEAPDGFTYKTYVCGYKGNEKDITIPIKSDGVKLKGAKLFKLFTSTVETVHIPKEVEVFDTSSGAVFTVDTIKKVTVDDANPNYTSINGVLFDKDCKTLIYYPPKREDTEYVIPETVEIISDSISSPYLKSLTITPNVKKPPIFSSNSGLTEIYYKNVQFNKKAFSTLYSTNNSKASNATIYCIEGSELYKAFKSVSNKNTYYKELVALEAPKVPSKKAVINSVSYLDTANAVKLEMKDIGVTGFNIYRYSETSKIYEYIGYTLDNTYYDTNVKKGVSYGYKVRPFNTENLVIAEGRFSDVKSLGNAIEAPIESALESSPEISEPTIDSEPEATEQSNESLSKETNTENNKKENNNLIIWIVLAVVLFGGIATGVAVIIKHKK